MSSRTLENQEKPEKYVKQPLPPGPSRFNNRTDPGPTTSHCRTCIEAASASKNSKCDGKKPTCGQCSEKGVYCRWSIIPIPTEEASDAGEVAAGEEETGTRKARLSNAKKPSQTKTKAPKRRRRREVDEDEDEDEDGDEDGDEDQEVDKALRGKMEAKKRRRQIIDEDDDDY